VKCLTKPEDPRYRANSKLIAELHALGIYLARLRVGQKPCMKTTHGIVIVIVPDVLVMEGELACIWITTVAD